MSISSCYDDISRYNALKASLANIVGSLNLSATKLAPVSNTIYSAYRGGFVKANTMEMRQIASEIKALAVDYQTKISQMYSKFSNMPTVTNEWTGGQAQKYVSYVLLEKQDMMFVGDQLKEFAKVIADDATLLENNAASVRKDESSE